MLKEVEEGIPKGKSGQKQPHIRLINFRTTQEIYCHQKETVYKKEGLKEALLCWDCEQRLADGEKYVRRVLFGTGPIKKHTNAMRYRIWHQHKNGGIFTEGIELRWVDFARFKQFQLGVIWKACIARGNAFKDATAPETTIEEMRNSIYSENYDERLVPCVMERLHDPTGSSIKFIALPKSDSSQSGRISIVMGGYIWNYFPKGNVDVDVVLQKHGKMVVKILDVNVFYALS